jgi:hypothetical protein
MYSIPSAKVASAVHIDIDVGAFESLEDFLAIVETNQVRRQKDQDTNSFVESNTKTQYQKIESASTYSTSGEVPIVLHLSRPVLSQYFRPDMRTETIALSIPNRILQKVKGGNISMNFRVSEFASRLGTKRVVHLSEHDE